MSTVEWLWKRLYTDDAQTDDDAQARVEGKVDNGKSGESFLLFKSLQ